MLLGNHAVFGVHNKVAPTRLAAMMLFAMANMAIFLEALGSTS
jgi:hypothetical protein